MKPNHYKIFIILLLLSSAVLTTSNIISVKYITLLGLDFSPTVFLIPISYVILTFIVLFFTKKEIYEFLLFQVFFLLLISFILSISYDLPGSTMGDISFTHVFENHVVMTIASLSAYLISSIAIIELLYYWKNTKPIFLKLLLGSILILLVDTLLFKWLLGFSISGISFDFQTSVLEFLIKLLYIVILSILFYFIYQKQNKTDQKVNKRKRTTIPN